jgi:hypothetical protein
MLVAITSFETDRLELAYRYIVDAHEKSARTDVSVSRIRE